MGRIRRIFEKYEDFKAWIVLFIIKLLFDSDNREFIIRWSELKLGIIEKSQFDKWVTKQILDE